MYPHNKYFIEIFFLIKGGALKWIIRNFAILMEQTLTTERQQTAERNTKSYNILLSPLQERQHTIGEKYFLKEENIRTVLKTSI